MRSSIVLRSEGSIAGVGAAVAHRLGYEPADLVGRKLRDIDPDLCPCSEIPGIHRLTRGETFAYLTTHRHKGGDRFGAAVELHPFTIDGALHVVGRVAYSPVNLRHGGGTGLARVAATGQAFAAIASAFSDTWPRARVRRLFQASWAIECFAVAMHELDQEGRQTRRATAVREIAAIAAEDGAALVNALGVVRGMIEELAV